jgi:hypothetical protein
MQRAGAGKRRRFPERNPNSSISSAEQAKEKIMAGVDFRLPGFDRPIDSPETYISGVLRNFREASQALGRAVELLVLRLARSKNGGDPDYQIQTLDGEDAAAFSGSTHDYLYEDITIHLEEPDLQDQTFSAEQVKDWLNVINGEGSAGGQINPILSDRWTEADLSDPRD